LAVADPAHGPTGEGHAFSDGPIVAPVLPLMLIPRGGKAGRAVLSPDLWRVVAKRVRERAASRCQACGVTMGSRGSRASERPEAHEGYHWIESAPGFGIQELVSIRLLCSLDHHVSHMDRTWRLARHDPSSDPAAIVSKCLDRLARMNGWSMQLTRQYGLQELRLQHLRSSRLWALNADYFRMEFGIPATSIGAVR